jgi:hypothetical protein
MKMLDRTRDFGRISPPWTPDGCDRPAHYEQAGLLFDNYDRQVEPGVAAPPIEATEEEHDPDEQMTPSQLIQGKDILPWALFLREAKRILGKTCPPGKEAIVQALQKALAGYQDRQARRGTPRKRAAAPGTPPEVQDAAPGAVATPSAGAIDLAAWGRGQKNYLWAEVQKAIRTAHSKQVTEKRDAVDFLIELQIISAAEARKDAV